MWCHEWLKHGTCASGIQDMRTEHGYFSTVLWLYETRLNFDKFVLAKHNIVPSTTQTYNVNTYTWTVTKYYIFNVILLVLYYNFIASIPGLAILLQVLKALCQYTRTKSSKVNRSLTSAHCRLHAEHYVMLAHSSLS